MAKTPFTPTRQQIIDVFQNALTYEVLFTFGVPAHDPNDYCNWEAINFNRMAHARLLYDFLEQPIATRCKDNVLAEDFGYAANRIPLPEADRQRLNKDLMHLTYDRLRHTPVTRPWPDSILAMLQDPMVGFMQHVTAQSDLLPTADHSRFWGDLISCLTSGRQMIITGQIGPNNAPQYKVELGTPLPAGRAALTRLGQQI